MKQLSKRLALLLALSVYAPVNAQAETPAEIVVHNFYNQLETTMKEASQLGFTGRYKKLDPVIRTSFDMPLMTKTAVGSAWSSGLPEQQQQLIGAFTDFTVASYAAQFASYDGEKFKITGEKAAAGGELVETQLVPKDGAPIALDYMLRQDQTGQYRIVDVFLNGAISQVAARRSEFSSIAQQDGIAALVTSLGEKSKQLGPS